MRAISTAFSWPMTRSRGSVGMWMSSVVPTSSRAVGARWAPSLAGVVTVARESAREGNRFVAEPRGEGSATGGARLAGADRGPEVRLCKDADLLGHLPDGSESGRDDRPDPLLLGHIEEPLANDPVEDDRLRGGRQVRERLDHVLYGGLADDDVALSDKEALRLVLDAVQELEVVLELGRQWGRGRGRGGRRERDGEARGRSAFALLPSPSAAALGPLVPALFAPLAATSALFAALLPRLPRRARRLEPAHLEVLVERDLVPQALQKLLLRELLDLAAARSAGHEVDVHRLEHLS